ncbi:MAG: excinuclease ABC subunit UvrA [Kistimonas sp.]|nr:excinuclease ABC subunit UvrA [Kistimonas sp.]
MNSGGCIHLKGARTHNLKNIDLDIPRNKLTVITGLSGSGKSSLAFDTLYAEGQRRYVESLSSYARQFLSVMEKPDIDSIAGLSPAISIEQKSTSHNPRSTVGTVTEIYDYLRLLFARAGTPFCPQHKHPLTAMTVSQMTDRVMDLPEGTAIMILAPVIRTKKGEHVNALEDLKRQGFVRARIDGQVTTLDSLPALHKNKKHTVEVVVDRVKIREGLSIRLAESLETALNLTGGLASISPMEEYVDAVPEDILLSSRYSCPECGYSLQELEPRLFSFNNPAGACPGCDGLGVNQFFDPARIVPDEERSLATGAISGWDNRRPYFFQMLKAVAQHYDFSMDAPFEELSAEHQQIILYGSGKTRIAFHYSNDRGHLHQKSHVFEGVIPNCERRYKTTDSMAVREELAKYMATRACPECKGTRLKEAARAVLVDDMSLPSLTSLSVAESLRRVDTLALTGQKQAIASSIIREVMSRLTFLDNVGLGYLTLDRSANTLSGGESQRIRLASQIGAGLVGVMYILDEPSIGLHQRDNDRLLATLTQLRNIGNTVIVVEHDEDAIRAADHVIDVGPGAGVHGGQIVAQGTPEQVAATPGSLTGNYLSGERCIPLPDQRMPTDSDRMLLLKGCCANNLRNIDLELPLGLFTCVTGVSGSGKSTLVNATLYPLLAHELNGARPASDVSWNAVEGLEHLDKCVDIDQSPIGRTPRSNPATYTGIFTPVRELFAGTPEARSRGYTPGRFSFNMRGGRCEACKGDGVVRVEMHFLPDIHVACDVCKGKRYNRETLEIKYKGKNIHEVLEMTVEEALTFFDAIPAIKRKLSTLMDVGLSYICLGQNATTLSGGEAQRVKLSRELSRKDTGNTLYILDEPTTGLHFEDIRLLLGVLHRLRDRGNTVLVIEHNLDVIKTADWVVDLGPEGGVGGGRILAAGTPEHITTVSESHTGRFLEKTMHQHALRKQEALLSV